MITITDLHTALLELLEKIRESEIKLIIGGGFGIYLKTDHVKRLDIRTLLDQWPELQIEEFMSVLQELFPVGAEPFSQAC
jgi:hypothetical protein